MARGRPKKSELDDIIQNENKKLYRKLISERSETLKNRINFMFFITVQNCNPNGDPLNGNRPRTNFEGYGEISDVCIKRKIRNRMNDLGHEILIINPLFNNYQKSIKSIVEDTDFYKYSTEEYSDENIFKIMANKKWLDVRSFGQIFTYDKKTSTQIRGPVSLSMGTSIDIVTIKDQQIIKGINNTITGERASETMGQKYLVEKGVYVVKGSIVPQLASLTGYTYDDAMVLKECIMTLFEGDESSARPAGSMALHKLLWWECEGSYSVSPLKCFNQFKIVPCNDFPFYKIEKQYDLKNIKLEILSDFNI